MVCPAVKTGAFTLAARPRTGHVGSCGATSQLFSMRKIVPARPTRYTSPSSSSPNDEIATAVSSATVETPRRVGLRPSGMIDVDAEHLAEQLRQILRAIPRVVPRAAVAHAKVEVPVRPELDHATVVIGEGLRDHEQRLFLGGRDVRIRRGDPVLGDHRRAIGRARVVHEEPAVLLELRMEREPQEALLAAEQHARRDVQKDRRRYGPGPEDLDDPALLDDEQASAAIVRIGGENGDLEIGDRRHQRDGCPGRGGKQQTRGHQDGDDRADQTSPHVVPYTAGGDVSDSSASPRPPRPGAGRRRRSR